MPRPPTEKIMTCSLCPLHWKFECADECLTIEEAQTMIKQDMEYFLSNIVELNNYIHEE